ncbi:MAG TPA: PH domain-containing protein [Thermoanaerobaculia bacterium]|nr:PH domain-containing protein [Thermoanaerobaculia bacterium]
MSDIESRVFAMTRPRPELMTYYFLSSFVVGPLFFVPLIYLYFRYHTMRYDFDREGISMKWGILFRREITLTYARIQDIHLTSNIVERWLGLAKIQIQTASASSQAEMTLEGLHDFELVRDYLYSRMRGSSTAATAAHATGGASPAAPTDVNLATALHEVAVELRAVAEALKK